MSYPKLPENLDRRVKIPKSEHSIIRQLYLEMVSIRGIARLYGVDHRTIQFILFPERLATVREHLLERGGSKVYYKRERHRNYMRNHRAHKHRYQHQGVLQWRRETRKEKKEN